MLTLHADPGAAMCSFFADTFRAMPCKPERRVVGEVPDSTAAA
ncbi:MAG: hypothetical protein ACSLE9_19745 [Burkholderiaceae bacterium]